MRRNLNKTQFDQPDALPSRGSRVRGALSRAVPSKSFVTEAGIMVGGYGSAIGALATSEQGSGWGWPAAVAAAGTLGAALTGIVSATNRFDETGIRNSANKKYGTNVPAHKAPFPVLDPEKERAKYEAIDAKLNASRGAKPKR